jgi:hypothetical protein
VTHFDLLELFKLLFFGDLIIQEHFHQTLQGRVYLGKAYGLVLTDSRDAHQEGDVSDTMRVLEAGELCLLPRPETLAWIHGELFPMRLILDWAMHFFEELNHIDGVVKLDVVKLIGDGQVDEKFVILRLSHTLIARRIVHIKEGVMHRVKNDNDLKLTSLSLPHLPVLLQAHHLLKQDTAEVISHERLLALIH